MLFKKNLKFASFVAVTVFLTLGLSISFSSLLAAWTAPTAAPPAGNTAPLIYNESATPATSALINVPLGVSGNLTVNPGGIITGDGSSITSIDGDNITNGTIDSSEIEDNTLTASDLADNACGDSEMIDSPTFTSITLGGTNKNAWPSMTCRRISVTFPNTGVLGTISCNADEYVTGGGGYCGGCTIRLSRPSNTRVWTLQCFAGCGGGGLV